ncbi:MAG: hypothetical protein U0353_22450 [Sandaracinus sp.]
MTHAPTTRRLGGRLAGLALLASLAACGPSAQRIAAEDTVRTASRGLGEAHASGGEDPAVHEALGEADQWLAHSEEAVADWGTGPRSLAWETMAPCLARALRDLRDALSAAGSVVPADLETAEVSAAAVSDDACPRRRP